MATPTKAPPKRLGLTVRKLANPIGTPGGVHHPDHATGAPAKYPLRGVVFCDIKGIATEAPKLFRMPHDYAQREHWVELVNARVQVRPAGRADAPFSVPPHVFPQCDELVLHMLDGDYRYKVVGQPDKYLDGVPADAAGDPNAECRWYFDADLIGKV